MKTAFLLLLLFSKIILSQDPLNFLNEYISINTKENSLEGVKFFQKIFEKNKIKYEILGKNENPSILGMIEGKNENLKPFLLIHHIDCVNGGNALIRHKYFMEGPCLIDDKSLGIAHLFAFLEANKLKPERGIYFLAVSDEEKGGIDGTGYLIENKLLPEFEFALGEGGKSSNVTDKKLFISISNTDKGVLWLEIVLPLSGGHSISTDDKILREYLKKIYSLPSIFPFTGKFKEFQEFVRWYKDAFPRDRKVPQNLDEIEEKDKIFVSTSLSITSIKTDGGGNKLPSNLSLTLDLRTADKENHNQILKYLAKEFPDGKINKLLELYPSPTSSPENLYFKKIIKILKEFYPSLPIGPSINPGFSDLRYLREANIPSFGFSPFFLNYYHEGTIHKKEERMPKERFIEGVELMKKLVLKLSEE